MQREIKFRGKKMCRFGRSPNYDYALSKWYFGYLHRYYNGSYYNTISQEEEYDIVEYEVDRCIGQFTGLLDINGKEIYEGDIMEELRLNGERHFFKIWATKGGFVTNSTPEDFFKPIKKIKVWEGLSDMLWAGFISSTKVIGNIHDNPEMLELSPVADV